MKWIFIHFYIDILVTIGCIEPFLRKIDDQTLSMVVFLDMMFLKYYHAKNPYFNAILDLDCANNKDKFLFTFYILGRKSEERKTFGYTQPCFIEYLSTV